MLNIKLGINKTNQPDLRYTNFDCNKKNESIISCRANYLDEGIISGDYKYNIDKYKYKY